MTVPTRVLFVCLGNICRSPTAEAVFSRLVRDAGLDGCFEVDSAGTGGWHVGELAHPETRRAAARRGIEITHRARQVRREDFDRFDWIVAMDRQNARDLARLARSDEQRAKIRLFREFDAGAGRDERDVPDPYHDGCFEEVLDICERASRGLLEQLRPR